MSTNASNGVGRKARPVGTPKTQRLRKIECSDCGYLAYVSRRWIALGLPLCPCGARLLPEDADDAALVLSAEELEQHPAVIAYCRALSSVMHGQPSHGIRGRKLRPAEEIAMERVEKDRRERAQRNRLEALKSLSERGDEPIPF